MDLFLYQPIVASPKLAKVSKHDVCKVFSFDLDTAQKVVKPLPSPADNGSAVTLADQQHSAAALSIESDRPSSLVPLQEVRQKYDSGSGAGPFGVPSSNGRVFFRPVEGNMSYYTFLGTAFKSDFDFLAQFFAVVEVNRDERGRMQEVILGQASSPQCVRLSHLAYDTLSAQLTVWEPGELGYRVTQPMSLDLLTQNSIHFCLSHCCCHMRPVRWSMVHCC